MRDFGATGEPVPLLTSRAVRLWSSVALFAIALVVSVPAYTGIESRALQILYRFGLPVLWGALALASTGSERLRPIRPVLLSLFGVSLGLGLAYIVGDRAPQSLGLSVATPAGAAVAKLSEVIPIWAAIFLATFLAGRNLGSLSLRKGRLWLSLSLGALSAAPLLAFLVLVPGTGAKDLLAEPAARIASSLPWIVLFSLANGFMEEVWFRGSWFGAFRELIGSPAAMHVTSLAFAFWHVIVYWREPAVLIVLWPVFLYLGYACVIIVRKTGCLWGAVLGHMLADVMFVLAAFASSQTL
jgi:membrane protease YdiL (CAAX protease family)